MSVSQPSESFPVGGKSGCGMRLPLRSAGDQNGNAFPVSSSSSSSSFSSCLGESSPDSLRSLSSLSGGHIDSPLDVDMFEITGTTVMSTTTTATDKIADVIVSKWPPEEEENGVNDAAGKIQTVTELSVSNNNSVSVYLDANSSDYIEDTWNDNLTLAVSVATSSSISGYRNVVDSDDLSSGCSHGQRRGSSTPDSDATEIPADDDDDDEEELFLSVSSDLRRTSVTLKDLNHQPSEGLSVLGDSDTASSSNTTTTSIMTPTLIPASLPDPCVELDGRQSPSGGSNSMELQGEGRRVVKVPDDEMQEMEPDRSEMACPVDLQAETPTPYGVEIVHRGTSDGIVQNRIEPPASEDRSEPTQTTSSTSINLLPVSKESKFKCAPPQEGERAVVGTNPALPKTRQPARTARTKPTATSSVVTKPPVSTTTKLANPEAKSVPKQDLKNVKSKVVSRPTPSAPKTANQVVYNVTVKILCPCP